MPCRLTELNAIRQVFNVCSSPVVQSAWDAGQTLSVHGLAYSVGDGLLKVIVCGNVLQMLKTVSRQQSLGHDMKASLAIADAQWTSASNSYRCLPAMNCAEPSNSVELATLRQTAHSLLTNDV